MDIEFNEGEEVVAILKMLTATQLSQIEEVLLCVDAPKRENFDTEEDYQYEVKYFMKSMVEAIEEAKKQLFDNVLDSYNEYLLMKHNIENEMERENEESAAYIINAQKDGKATTIVSIIAAVFFPTAIPIIGALSLSRLGFDAIQIKTNLNRVIRNNEMKDLIDSMQDPFYEFTNTLRTDYHKSKEELKELKEKAENGENVMGDLLDIINPERVQLERIDDIRILPDFGEESMQLIKRD